MINLVLTLVLAAFSGQATATNADIEAQLRRHTQEIFDATAAGDRAPFQKYFADDVSFFDEKGRWMSKREMLADLQPLPTGYSGSITIRKLRSNIQGNVAILSYDLDETETIYGQQLHARYHETDTWLSRGGQWQIAAGQVLRYYEDPAPGRADPSKFPEYIGTYQLAPGITMAVTAESDKLYSQRASGPKQELIPEASGIFFRKGIEGRRLFRYSSAGKVDALIDRRNNEDVVWSKLAASAKN